MIRVFVDAGAAHDGRLLLDGPDARHVGGSLRARPGEELVAVEPGGIEHLCKVLAATSNRVDLEVISSAPSPREPRVRLRICQALLKGDQFERIIEYGSEAGAESFQPMLTQRTIPRLDEGAVAGRMERWSQVARTGAALGQRGRLPAVLPVLRSVRDAVARATADGFVCFILYEGAGLESLSQQVPVAPASVCLLVGPEGGWSGDEVDAAIAGGAVAVTLGPRIMRPLPAALMALAVVFHVAGELEDRRPG